MITINYFDEDSDDVVVMVKSTEQTEVKEVKQTPVYPAVDLQLVIVEQDK